jgi:hypothetical protein
LFSAAEADVTRAYLEHEMPAAEAFAGRKGLELSFSAEALRAELRLAGPAENDGAPDERFFVTADFAGYRAVPPLWCFVDPRDGAEVGLAGYPKPAPGQSSIFHPNGVVCAPWNRGAYSENGGPHNDWNGVGNWEHVRGWTIALTVGEMIDVLYRQTRAARGRYAPLPSRTA